MVTRPLTMLIGSSAVLGLLTVGACMEDAPTAPPCNAVAFDTAAVSGDTITTSTGLRFIDDSVGEGAPLGWCQLVVVHYDGYLLNGTKFDSSRDIDRALTFTPGLGVLIEGFEQGVIGMRFRGLRRLIIPPELAYGDQPVLDQNGTVVVPANSTLVFDVEVLGIGIGQ